MEAALRAFIGYFFVVLIVRIVGRRPGKQLTPFEFVLIFFMGGLALTAIVDELSFTNAICQVIAIALAHRLTSWIRSKSSRAARLIDGTPLILIERDQWRTETMTKMRIADDDVMFAARDKGLRKLSDVERAILERNGDISVLPK
jgi:uncharacterized membrane protein YcaP (DUF421 family)